MNQVIPADRKWVSRALVAKILVETIDSLGLKFPEVSADGMKAIEATKKKLEAEKS